VSDKREIEIPSRAITSGVDVRIFNVANRGSKLVKFKAERGKGYTAEGVQGLLDGIVEMLDKQFPREEFDIVRTGPFKYNVVWRSTRPAPAGLDPVSG
jgi:hypothetical protein